MNLWKLNGTEISGIQQIPEEMIGFCYKITNKKNGKFYIGRKIFFSERKVKLSKKEKLLSENKRKTYKYVKKETNWLNYWGSCEELLSDIKLYGEESFEREIIHLCKSKIDITFYEAYHQILNNVIFIDSYNNNILGKFYRGKITC